MLENQTKYICQSQASPRSKRMEQFRYTMTLSASVYCKKHLARTKLLLTIITKIIILCCTSVLSPEELQTVRSTSLPSHYTQYLPHKNKQVLARDSCSLQINLNEDLNHILSHSNKESERDLLAFVSMSTTWVFLALRMKIFAIALMNQEPFVMSRKALFPEKHNICWEMSRWTQSFKSGNTH